MLCNASKSVLLVQEEKQIKPSYIFLMASGFQSFPYIGINIDVDILKETRVTAGIVNYFREEKSALDGRML